MFFLFVEHLGERALAITNIIRNVSGIPFSTMARNLNEVVSNLIGAGEIKCVPERSANIRIGIFSCCRWLYSSHCFLTWYWVSIRIFPICGRPPSLLYGYYAPLIWPANVYFQAVSGTATHVRRWDWNSVYWPFIWLYHLYDSLSESGCSRLLDYEHLYGICILFLSYLYIRKETGRKSRFDLILLIFAALLWKRTLNSTKPSNT